MEASSAPHDHEESARSAIPDDVTALDVDGVGAVLIGTIVWGVALVVLWLDRDGLAAQGRTWWVWCAAAGTVFGLLGLPYVVARRQVYREAASGSASPDTSSPDASSPDASSADSS